MGSDEGRRDVVAPYVGAWIETVFDRASLLCSKSHPTWVRGLKQLWMNNGNMLDRSHPTWVRGLKHNLTDGTRKLNQVAPYVGAWIET